MDHHFDNETQALRAIEAWRDLPPSEERRNLQLAIQSVELGQMYYEQKNNPSGVLRLDRCLKLLSARLAELKEE